MTTGSPRTTSGWAMGLVTFAGALMLMAGVFQAISGLAAIFDDEFFVVTQNYVFDLDASAWGWVHLLLGLVLAFAGWAVFSGAAWGYFTVVAFVSVPGSLIVFLRSRREWH